MITVYDIFLNHTTLHSLMTWTNIQPFGVLIAKIGPTGKIVLLSRLQ
jgi:hypothetical protein